MQGQEMHTATREAQAGRAAAIRARAESRRAQGPHARAAGGPESRAERMTVAIETQKETKTAVAEAEYPATRKKLRAPEGDGLVCNDVQNSKFFDGW